VRIVGHVREEKRKIDGKTAVVRETIRKNAAPFYFLSTTVSNAAAFDHGASSPFQASFSTRLCLSTRLYRLSRLQELGSLDNQPNLRLATLEDR
jgi:hypothetical protein